MGMDSQMHKSRHLATHQLLMQSQYKTWGWGDILIVIGVFVIGFVFAFVLNSYGSMKKEKIEEISRKFQGLKGEYESVHHKMEAAVKWRYRIRFAEKVFYIMIIAFGFLVYKSPSILSWLLTEHALLSIMALSISVLSFTLAGWYLEK